MWTEDNLLCMTCGFSFLLDLQMFSVLPVSKPPLRNESVIACCHLSKLIALLYMLLPLVGTVTIRFSPPNHLSRPNEMLLLRQPEIPVYSFMVTLVTAVLKQSLSVFPNLGHGRNVNFRCLDSHWCAHYYGMFVSWDIFFFGFLVTHAFCSPSDLSGHPFSVSIFRLQVLFPFHLHSLLRHLFHMLCFSHCLMPKSCQSFCCDCSLTRTLG